MIHLRTHPTYVEGCFMCRVSSVRVGAGALITRKPDVIDKTAWSDGMQRDMAAYKTLRGEGLQPTGIRGSHKAMMTSDDYKQVEGLPKLWEDRHDLLVGGVGEKWSDIEAKVAS